MRLVWRVDQTRVSPALCRSPVPARHLISLPSRTRPFSGCETPSAIWLRAHVTPPARLILFATAPKALNPVRAAPHSHSHTYAARRPVSCFACSWRGASTSFATPRSRRTAAQPLTRDGVAFWGVLAGSAQVAAAARGHGGHVQVRRVDSASRYHFATILTQRWTEGQCLPWRPVHGGSAAAPSPVVLGRAAGRRA